jgi:hypothetical protein
MELIFASSPEPSGPLRQFVISGLLLCVGKPRQHSGGRSPSNLALCVEVPHCVACFFELAKDLGDQLCSGPAWAVVFHPLVFDICPEPENLCHTQFHGRPPFVISCLSALKLA